MYRPREETGELACLASDGPRHAARRHLRVNPFATQGTPRGARLEFLLNGLRRDIAHSSGSGDDVSETQTVNASGPSGSLQPFCLRRGVGRPAFEGPGVVPERKVNV